MSTTYVAGEYQAEVLSQGFAEAGTGTPFFFLQIKVLGRYDGDGRVQACPQFERTYRQYLKNDAGIAILRGELKAIGVEVSDLIQLSPEIPTSINLTGRTINAFCTTEVYNGQEREKWQLRQPRKKVSLNTIRELSTKFGHVLHSGSQKPATTGTTPATASDSVMATTNDSAAASAKATTKDSTKPAASSESGDAAGNDASGGEGVWTA